MGKGKIFTLYKIVCLVNNKLYIGITHGKVSSRWSQHVCSSKKPTKTNKLYLAMKKYGVDNFVIYPTGYAESWEVLLDLEIRAIAFYDSHKKGYNTTSGGEGVIGASSWVKGLTKETSDIVKRISDSQKGVNNSFFGKTHSKEIRLIWSSCRSGDKHPMFGVKRPDLATKNKDRVWTDESKNKISQKKSKPVMWVETGIVYQNATVAGKILKTDPKMISEVARGKRKKTKGMSFVFVINPNNL